MRRTSDKLDWLARVAADARISVAGLRVAVVLANRLNLKTSQLNPSRKTLANDTQMTEQGVKRGLDSLVKNGWISRTTRQSRSNTFELLQTPEVSTIPPQQNDPPRGGNRLNPRENPKGGQQIEPPGGNRLNPPLYIYETVNRNGVSTDICTGADLAQKRPPFKKPKNAAERNENFYAICKSAAAAD